VGRKLSPPGAEQLEGVPEASLRDLLVERLVDVRHVERLDRRREPLELALLRLERRREREGQLVDEGDRRLAHYDEQLRLADVQLPRQPGLRLRVRGAAGELQAVRSVHRHRVDAQALKGLEERLAGPPVEGDALLRLWMLRTELQEEDV